MFRDRFFAGIFLLVLMATVGWASPAFAQPDPGVNSSLFVTGGTLNGIDISGSGPRIVVQAGNVVSGTIELEYTSQFQPPGRVMLAGTPTWGDPVQRGFDLGELATPAGGAPITVDLEFEAPWTVGSHRVLFAFLQQFTAQHVLSMTDWRGGSPVWYDGNDIAGWSFLQLQQVSAQGRATGRLLADDGSYDTIQVPAAALEVIVIAGDPAESSSATIVGGTLNNVDLSQKDRIVVGPGVAINGTLRVATESYWNAGQTVRMVTTPSWGDPQTEYADQGAVSPGETVHEVPVSLHAPQTAGVYSVIVAFRAGLDAAQLASMTEPSYAAPVWGDDNDIARWTPGQIEEANERGRVIGQLLIDDGAYQDTYVPAAAVEIVVDDTDPGAMSDLRITGGELAGVPLVEGQNRVFVRAGEELSGSVQLNYLNAWPAGAGVAFGATPTWGDPATGGIDLSELGADVDAAAATVPLTFTAPPSPGLYHLFFAYRAEQTVDNVLSMTAPAVGAPVWGDGNDVASWGDDEHDEALENGRVLGRRLQPDGSYRHLFVPAACVEVVVIGDDPGADSTLHLSSGVFPGAVVTAGQRQLEVAPGEVVQGTVHLRYTSAWPEASRVQLGWTPSWGDPAGSAVGGGVLVSPAFNDQISVPVQFTAPTANGTYRLAFAFRSAPSLGHLMSMTADDRSVSWNDGNDVASWRVSQFEAADASGHTLASLQGADGVRQVWVPATTIEVVVDTLDPGHQSSLEIVSGVINGVHYPASWAHRLTVAPGQCLFGELELAYTSGWPAGQPVVFGLTPTWGDPSTAYGDVRQLASPAVGAPIDLRVNITAPRQAGSYWLVLAFRGASDAAQLFSMTADDREPSWGDGNEVADWSLEQIDEANTYGRTRARLLSGSGEYREVAVPAVAIELVVESTDFGDASSLELRGGAVNEVPVGADQQRVRVPAGDSINGEVRLGWSSAWPEGTRVPMGMTTTWGSAAQSVSPLGTAGDPIAGERVISISETAPEELGLHRLIFAFRADEGLGAVFSMTDGRFGEPVWGDGNDIAGWGLQQIEQARQEGRATGILRYPSGLYISTQVPAAVIDIDTTAAAPPVAASATARLLVPAAADTPGALGTRWLTDLVLHNPGDADVTARVYFLDRRGDGVMEPVGRVLTVPAQESRKLESVLAGLFELHPAVGGLMIAADGSLMVSSATYNPVGNGRFGQHIVGLAMEDLVQGREEAALIGLTGNEEFRSNIGFVNTMDTPINVEVRYFLADGAEIGMRGYQIAGYQMLQVDGALAELGVGAIDDGFAVVRAVEDDAHYAVYSSVVNRLTGDPVYGSPVRASDEPLYLGGMANAVGRFNTYWLSDVQLYNPGDELAECELRFRLADQFTMAPRRVQVSVPARSTVRLADVVGDTFRISGSGGLRIVPLRGVIAASAMTYNVGGVNGQYGQHIPAFFDAEAIEGGETGRIIHLANSIDLCTGFRTNIGVLNASPYETDVQVELYRGDGTYMLTRILRLYPYGYHQENDILNCVTRTNVFDGYAIVRAVNPDVRFFAFASVVDTVSGDALYIPAEKP